MAPKQGSTWDHKSDKDLLLTIIEMGKLQTIMWPEIANKMQAKGYTFTKEACRQHFQKIRKEAQKGSDSTASPARAAAKNPKPSGATTTPQKAGMAQNGSFKSTFDNHEEDDEEDMSQGPNSKRVKLEAQRNGYGQSAPLFKVEHLTGNGHAAPVDLENNEIYEADYPDYA